MVGGRGARETLESGRVNLEGLWSCGQAVELATGVLRRWIDFSVLRRVQRWSTCRGRWGSARSQSRALHRVNRSTRDRVGQRRVCRD
jgi:hypothetical protein